MQLLYRAPVMARELGYDNYVGGAVEIREVAQMIIEAVRNHYGRKNER